MAMASTRRLGLESSATRTALMDAVEAVMLKEGYGALSARSVAECAGLKHQLVYYYFQTMDDLLMATFRRYHGATWAKIEQASRSERPLRALWEAWSNPDDAKLNSEYMGLANHNEAIRLELVDFGERVRRLSLERIADQASQDVPDREVFTPFAISLALSYIGSTLGNEIAIGFTGGHQDVRALVEWSLDRLEPKTG